MFKKKKIMKQIYDFLKFVSVYKFRVCSTLMVKKFLMCSYKRLYNVFFFLNRVYRIQSYFSVFYEIYRLHYTLCAVYTKNSF